MGGGGGGNIYVLLCCHGKLLSWFTVVKYNFQNTPSSKCSFICINLYIYFIYFLINVSSFNYCIADTCYRRILEISWKDRKTNEFVKRGIKARAGQHVTLLGRDSEKKKTCMVWPHFSPQQPGQNSASGNSRGMQKARKTG